MNFLYPVPRHNEVLDALCRKIVPYELARMDDNVVTYASFIRTYNHIYHIYLNTTRFRSYKEYQMAFKSEWQFIHCELTEKDKPALEAYADSIQRDPMVAISELLAQGYKLSCSWLDENNCFIFTMSGSKYTAYNTKASLSSRSDELEEAIIMTAYKHQVLANGRSWSDLDNPTKNWG